jgi:methionyl aminopeptidase
MLATVLDVLRNSVEVGMSTKDLANLARAELEKLGGKPPFLGYQGFPDVICISVNDEVVHGIPREDCVLKNGDIVGLDFGVNYQGMITDSAISVIVGNPVNDQQKQLVADTERAMMAGISVLRDGVKVGDIGAAVEAALKKKPYGIVRDLVGHGVGHELHEAPNIPNYGRSGTGMQLKAGMTIAIEPMVTLGREEVYVDNDQWTIKTHDGSRSAHFEHTILITADGYEILTQL